MIKAPTSFIQRLKFIGPSIIVTGSVVGSGSIALSPLLGAATGFALLWWLLLSLWSKPLIQAEISRYVIATNQTFLESFSDMPGPKTNLRGKQASWLVWFMFIGVIPSVAGMGGLAGAVAEAGHLMIPMLSTELWVVTACFVTWFILYLGTYQTLEKILLGMVFFFSVVTLIIAISMQSTPYAISGSQILGGEWSLNQMPDMKVQNLKSEEKIDFSNRIEGFLSGKSIEKNFYLSFKKKMTAKEIFFNYKKNEKDAIKFITDYKVKLARALVIIITTIDPDAIVFGGGVSNEIDFLDEIKQMTAKFINEPNLKTIFLKPLYGDASGVRGAALLGRENFI